MTELCGWAELGLRPLYITDASSGDEAAPAAAPKVAPKIAVKSKFADEDASDSDTKVGYSLSALRSR